MALSIAEADRRRDLANDLRRIRARADTKRRLSDQYRVQQLAAEREAKAIEMELKTLEDMR